jgi:hypothetical protein
MNCRNSRRVEVGILLALLAIPVGAATAVARSGAPDSLALVSGEPHGSKRVMREAEWAAELIETLGLAGALEPGASDAERFALLCPDRAELVTESGGRRVPARSAFRVTADAPAHKGPGEPLRLVVRSPASALYVLSVEGVGPQRWLVDGRLVGHLDPSPLGVDHAPALVPLRRGPHELSAYLAPRSRVQRIELDAHRSRCIAPADGWHGERPLTFAALARTLVHALGLEKDLPVVGDGIPIEGENFTEVSGGGERIHRRLENQASSGAWVKAASGPAEFTYRVGLEDPGVFSILGHLRGGGLQIWSIDGRYRTSLEPGGSDDRFEWNRVLTLPLGAGEHALRVFASRDSGIDRIRLVPHRHSGADYVALLAQAGFAEGAPDALVTHSIAFESLSKPVFAKTSHEFLTREARAAGRSRSFGAEAPSQTSPWPAAPKPTFQPELYRPETWR